MKLHVLGSNGWYPTNEASTVCTLIETNDSYIVLDAGSGIYKLDEYIKDDKPIYLFLSHFHLDHVYGFHAFPKFRFKQGITIFGQPGTKETLQTLMNKPFSVSFENLPFKVSVRDLPEGETLLSDTDLSIETGFLVHADPCFGYRLTVEDKTITYCTDTGYCENMVKLARDADLLITECALGVEEQPNPEWPHLNPKLAAQVAKEAGAKKLLLTHFGATNYLTNENRNEAKTSAQETFSPVVIAKDNLEIEI
jgi:ribonuclease BN (tRNA processing enzyme)